MGRSVLDWRAKHPDGMSYVESRHGDMEVHGYVPWNSNWYTELGLEPHAIGPTRQSPDEQMAVIDAILADDPSRNILNVLGDNRAASTALMAGERTDPATGEVVVDRTLGLRATRALLDRDWVVPETAKGDEAAARVIISGATPRLSGPESVPKAWAAANLFEAARQMKGALDSPLPDDLSHALGVTARAYSLDLARSTRSLTEFTSTVLPSFSGASSLQVDERTLVSVVGLLRRDPHEWGAFRGVVDVQMAAAMTAKLRNSDGPDDLSNMAKLEGMIAGAEADLKQSRDDAKNAMDARHKMFIKVMVNGGLDVLAGAATKIPATMPLGLALTLTTPAITEALPAGPLRDLNVTEDSLEEDRSRLRQSVVQALILDGTVPAPTTDWFQRGAMTVQDDDQRSSFNAWWGVRDKKVTDYEKDPQNAFNSGVTEWKSRG
jgi:hypothetical protein